jgi:hypothetical protein
MLPALHVDGLALGKSGQIVGAGEISIDDWTDRRISPL